MCNNPNIHQFSQLTGIKRSAKISSIQKYFCSIFSSIHCQKFLQQETFFLEGATKTFQCKEVVQKPSKGL